jgi:hypothetical protein
LHIAEGNAVAKLKQMIACNACSCAKISRNAIKPSITAVRRGAVGYIINFGNGISAIL